MPQYRIKLSRKQIEFISKMLEIPDSQVAIDKFCDIMLEERLSPNQMSKVIDIIMERMTKK